MGLFKTLFGKRKKDITTQDVYNNIYRNKEYDSLLDESYVITGRPRGNYFSTYYGERFQEFDIRFMHSISTDESFVDMLEAIQRHVDDKNTIRGNVVVIGLPTDYQLGKTLEYLHANKSMTKSEEFLDNISRIRVFNTPIGVQIAFRIDKELTR